MPIEVIQAPSNYIASFRPIIFLAGSIEMGKAEHWQDRLISLLSDTDAIVLNPRRDDWDNSWEQNIDNPQFREQVEWELTGLEEADIVAMYFDPNTKSPITLLELGLQASELNIIVCCPQGYWRKGNVDIVCRRYNLEQVDTIAELAGSVFRQLRHMSTIQ